MKQHQKDARAKRMARKHRNAMRAFARTGVPLHLMVVGKRCTGISVFSRTTSAAVIAEHLGGVVLENLTGKYGSGH